MGPKVFGKARGAARRVREAARESPANIREYRLDEAFTGGCLCGACRYGAAGPPIDVRACHCRACQQTTGSAFYARVLVARDTVSIEGPVGWFHSSPDLQRGFCTVCGSTLFSERLSAGTIGIALGSLDEPDRFRPAEHIWTSRRLAWIDLDDDFPQWLEGPPA